ncbi:glycosyltransferase family 2 protein [Mucilaginibacter robiniae]|uniref:Glycosyltransferase family 2 protein n=1 Tax=Mucilaginibacter robiniae TaxID=2728022 RepID=A0A7L5DVE8_9SPHI|nr:glycosyltransferase family A protein [Mucilaginibacter robiniae]QJD95070.1 glycosyltransferase family 2 protein [Mucilaginibacter robiniae]
MSVLAAATPVFGLVVADPVFQTAAKPLTELKVCVVVPVKDEALHLQQTLDALRCQTDEAGVLLNAQYYEVLVLANNCTDHSYTIARAYQQQYPDFQLHVDEVFLPPASANIGTVRRMLMDEAYRRLLQSGNINGIIASTDGDTIVDSQWIYHVINEIAAGNDAVGGRILAHSTANSARLHHLRNVTYRCLLAKAEALIDPQPHDPWPRHFQYFGASLAVTCAMYHKAGRLPQVPYLEDDAFHKALVRQDARIRKSYKVKVYTSDRTSGRVSIGFSEQLKKWTDESDAQIPQLVESTIGTLHSYHIRKKLRDCREHYLQIGAVSRKAVTQLSQELQADVIWLQHQIENLPSFGLLWEVVEPLLQRTTLYNHYQPEFIGHAIQQLRSFVKEK